MENNNQPTQEVRDHKKHGYTSVFARAYCYIDCPFCGATVKAFVWSLAGGGKKCTCGALHTSFNRTIKKIKPSKNEKVIPPVSTTAGTTTGTSSGSEAEYIRE